MNNGFNLVEDPEELRLKKESVQIYSKLNFLKMILGYSLSLLTRKQRFKLGLSVVIQCALSVLDLIGIALLGLLGAISLQSISQTDNLKVLDITSLEKYSTNTQSALLAGIAIGILILRTFLSIIVTRKTLNFLSHISAELSGQLMTKLLFKPIAFIQQKKSQELVFALTEGVGALVLGINGTLMVLFADIFLLCLLTGALIIFDTSIAISSIIFFGTVSVLTYLHMKNRVRELGLLSRKYTESSNQSVLDSLNLYRDLLLKSQRTRFAQKFLMTRRELTATHAELMFIPHVSKYVFETSVIIGGLIVFGVEAFANNSANAFMSMSVFIAASSRILPATLRLQQSLIQINTNLGVGSSTIDLIKELSDSTNAQDLSGEISEFTHESFDPAISLKNLCFSFENSDCAFISDVNLEILAGTFVAIVGPSGSGKSTLIDILLGIQIPTSGEVRISGLSPRGVFDRWPGAVSYVPQEIALIDSSIYSNIVFPYNPDTASRERVFDALEKSRLSDQFPQDSLNNIIGENGSKLSGGQKQRLGIARALYSNPKLLVLDEATSSLDAETEQGISNVLESLRGKTTVVVIAHRLSTVTKADKIIYMVNGSIKAEGSFDDLRRLVPDFDRQANIMGIQ